MSEQKDNKTKSAKQESWLTRHGKIILETSIDGFCVVSTDGKLVEVNQALCDISGYSRKELLVMKLADLESRESPEEIKQHILKVMKSGHDRFETKHRRKDGKIIDIEINTQYCDFEQEKFCFGFFRDITKRKQIEDELYLKGKAIHGSINGLAIGDPEGKLIYANPAFLDMWGYDKMEKVLRKKAGDFWQKKEEAENVQQILFSKGSWTGELTAKKNDGSFFDVQISATTVKDDAGKPLCLMGSFIDVSEKMKSEQSLRESGERLRVALSAAQMGTWRWNPSTNQDTRDASLNEILGLEAVESTQPVDDFLRYVHPEDRDMVDGEIQRSLREHRTYVAEFRIIRPDGTVRWLRDQGKPLYDENDHVLCLTGAVVDITEQKKMENALRESEERYKTLFEGAAEGIIVADIETKKFKYVNPAICKMLGYTEEELGRLCVCDLHSKEDLPHIISEFEAQARGEKTLSSSIPCLRKDGTIMYADINTTMVLRDERRYNVGFFTDVTGRKRIEADLENYKEKILQAQKHAYISSMGAVVAHQLNQPLTKINILLDRAVEQIEETSGCPSALKNVKQGLIEVKNATSIIKKFRQYSKDSAMEGVGKVNVSAVADRIVSVLFERATLAKMRIAIKGLGDLPEVETNETALEQIFLIITQNAIEAADGRKSHKLDITAKFDDDNIELQFSDDCCGIAPENLDKIFEPFFTTKTKDKGMGLGLDIVQQILISCGGQIRVESRPGRGTTFYVTLPVRNTLEY